MYVQNQNWFKTFYIFKNGTKTPKIANLYSHKDLFALGHSFGRKKPKTCSEQPHLASGSLMKVFYMTSTSPRRLLLSGPKSGLVLYSFECTLVQSSDRLK